MKKIFIILLMINLIACSNISDEYYIAHESNFEILENENGPYNHIVNYELYNNQNKLIDLKDESLKNEADIVLEAIANNVSIAIKEIKMTLNKNIWEAYVKTIDNKKLYFEYDLNSHQLFDHENNRLDFYEDNSLKEDHYYINYIIEEGINFYGLRYNIRTNDLSFAASTTYIDPLFKYNEENYLNIDQSLDNKHQDFIIDFSLIDENDNSIKVEESISAKDLKCGQINTLIFYKRLDNKIHIKIR